MKKNERSAGILLHITSLPGRSGCGTLGVEAKQFADFLSEAGFKFWQILPSGPVSPATQYSPYSSHSTFAGNPLFVSLSDISEGLDKPIIFEMSFEDSNSCDFDSAFDINGRTLFQSYRSFIANKDKRIDDYKAFLNFCDEESAWVDDYALFESLASKFGTRDWTLWDEGISSFANEEVKRYKKLLSESIEFHKYVQHVYFTQWFELKEYCNSRGIKLIGDIPIYVVFEGADAWAHREIFSLDEKGQRPSTVAGVPPDYFSSEGQRWGNPLYRWLNLDGTINEITYDWWRRRFAHLKKQFDVIRIDHFRGFESFWSIPVDEKTAIKGKWVKGPGSAFFEKLMDDFDSLPLIAEDLGVITPEVENLRDDYKLPGMKVLQFAFDGSQDNPYLPHNIHERRCVLYTGTHDNDTTNGWFYGKSLNDEKRRFIMEYLDVSDYSDMHWHLIKAAMRTPAETVIIPMQDLLGFGSEFRMNTPGTIGKNWVWKLKSGDIVADTAGKYKHLLKLYGRHNTFIQKD